VRTKKRGRKLGKRLGSFVTSTQNSARGCGRELSTPERKPRRRLDPEFGEIRFLRNPKLGRGLVGLDVKGTCGGAAGCFIGLGSAGFGRRISGRLDWTMLAFGWESLLDTARKKGRMPLTCGSHLAETNGTGLAC